MAFLNLPNELILLVAEELSAADVNSLLKTARPLAGLLTPRLHVLAFEDKDGVPALWWAVERSFEPLVHLLLSKEGIDVEVRNWHMTPLFVASKNGNEALVRLLLAHGAAADTNNFYQITPSHTGVTPFHTAVEEDCTGAIVKMFLESGVDPNMLSGLGKPALFIATEVGDLAIVRLLLDYGADVGIKDHRESTSLHEAARQGEVNIAEELLKRGAEVDARDECGITALCVASKKGHDTMVGLLIEAGADIDIQDDKGRTPLHRAVYYEHDLAVEKLLDAGADFEAQCDAGNTPLHIAAENGFIEIAYLLLEKGADIDTPNPRTGQTPLLAAADHGSGGIVEMLLEEGADLHHQDFSGHTALELAALGGFQEVVMLLQEQGAAG